MTKIAVLISGNGSNLQAILDATASGELPGVAVALVVSNRKDAYGMQRAFKSGVPVVYFPKLPYTNANRPRSDYDADLARIVQGFGVEWVVQAGWMHIFTNAFTCIFPNRILNLHPALPGMFPGMNSIAEAYAAYQRREVDQTGVMIHLVPDEAVDAGPVVAQVVVPILPEDSQEDLETRVHAAEHQLLVETVRAAAAGSLGF